MTKPWFGLVMGIVYSWKEFAQKVHSSILVQIHGLTAENITCPGGQVWGGGVKILRIVIIRLSQTNWSGAGAELGKTVRYRFCRAIWPFSAPKIARNCQKSGPKIAELRQIGAENRQKSPKIMPIWCKLTTVFEREPTVQDKGDIVPRVTLFQEDYFGLFSYYFLEARASHEAGLSVTESVGQTALAN